MNTRHENKEMLCIRTEPSNKKAWERAARSSGMTLSAFIRKSCQAMIERRERAKKAR